MSSTSSSTNTYFNQVIFPLPTGLEHSAFTIFNEAKLSETAVEYKFDMKPGHLLGLLEKALILTQIEQHMNFVPL